MSADIAAVITVLAVVAFLLAGLIALFAIVRGPAVADRVISLDVALISLMGGVAVHAAATADSTSLDLLLVIAIVGFTTTIAVSRFPRDGGDE